MMMTDEPAQTLFLDQHKVPDDPAGRTFIVLQNSLPLDPENEISEGKKLLQNVASNLNEIENTLREAVEQNIAPKQSTCNVVNKAHEDVEKVIALLEKIKHKSKSQEMDISRMKADIYDLNKKIESMSTKHVYEINRLRQDIFGLKTSNDRLRSGARIRYLLCNLQTRIYLHFVPEDPSKERKCEYDIEDLENKLRKDQKQVHALSKFLDQIGFNKKGTPKQIKKLLAKYGFSLDYGAYPEVKLLECANMAQFQQTLREFGVDDIHKNDFEELGEMYFKI
jgi:hypothetical protein